MTAAVDVFETVATDAVEAVELGGGGDDAEDEELRRQAKSNSTRNRSSVSGSRDFTSSQPIYEREGQWDTRRFRRTDLVPQSECGTDVRAQCDFLVGFDHRFADDCRRVDELSNE